MVAREGIKQGQAYFEESSGKKICADGASVSERKRVRQEVFYFPDRMQEE